MSVHDVLGWAPPLVGGATIGVLYFGGLWATVRRLPSARRPGLLALGSFAARAAVAVAGFVLLLAGDARRAAVALVGFVAVRIVAVRTVAVRRDPTGAATPEG